MPLKRGINMDSREEYQRNRQKFYKQLFELSNGCCFNCQVSDVEFHIHHIVPLADGGTNNRLNLSLLCLECHGKVHQKNFLKMSELSKKARLKKIEKPLLPPDEELLPMLVEEIVILKKGIKPVEAELSEKYYISTKDKKRLRRAVNFSYKTMMQFLFIRDKKGAMWDALMDGDYETVIRLQPTGYDQHDIPLYLLA